MRDVGPLMVDSKRIDAAHRQLNRLGLEEAHANGGARELPRAIEAVAVGGDHRRFAGFEVGIAVLYLGALGHALEQQARLSLGQDLVGEAYKGVMHVVIGNRGSNPVDVGGRHRSFPRWVLSSPSLSRR